MDFPPLIKEPTEVLLTDKLSVANGEDLIRGRLSSLAQGKDWSYNFDAVEVSQNKRFPIIVRTKVAWVIDGDEIQTIEVFFVDYNGVKGGNSIVLDE